MVSGGPALATPGDTSALDVSSSDA